jgi:hypothetical protein
LTIDSRVGFETCLRVRGVIDPGCPTPEFHNPAEALPPIELVLLCGDAKVFPECVLLPVPLRSQQFRDLLVYPQVPGSSAMRFSFYWYGYLIGQLQATLVAMDPTTRIDKRAVSASSQT